MRPSASYLLSYPLSCLSSSVTPLRLLCDSSFFSYICNMLVSYSENGGRFSYPQDKKCVKFHDKYGKQVPYLDIVFPKLSLEGILIGKQLNFETTEKAIKTLLQQTGYKKISVEQLMY